MDSIKIGLIGFGTIGTGVVRALNERSSFLKKKIGVSLDIKKICDKDITTPRNVKIEEGILTQNVDEVLNDPEIKIVIELVGGIHPAKEFIIRALQNGKHVVTANKALLASDWAELFKVADEKGVDIYFEASVAGGIPIIKSLREGLVANEIQGIYGIVNGTSNYILTHMEEQKYEFKEALMRAQDQGYAEKDPSLDIKGIDSAHKLAILASLGFGITVRLEDIYVEGIQDLSENDLEYASEFGYKIKLLAIAKKDDNELEVRVHPTLVPKEHLLSSVKGVYNAVYVIGDLIGRQLFYGQGAGQLPTSSAVIADVVDLAYNIKHGVRGRVPSITYDAKIKRIRKIDEIETGYYMRFSAIDRPGVLASIAGILGKNNISISSVSQKERKKEQIVPIVLMSHDAKEANVRAALNEIDALPTIKRKSIAIRIERKI